MRRPADKRCHHRFSRPLPPQPPGRGKAPRPPPRQPALPLPPAPTPLLPSVAASQAPGPAGLPPPHVSRCLQNNQEQEVDLCPKLPVFTISVRRNVEVLALGLLQGASPQHSHPTVRGPRGSGRGALGQAPARTASRRRQPALTEVLAAAGPRLRPRPRPTARDAPSPRAGRPHGAGKVPGGGLPGRSGSGPPRLRLTRTALRERARPPRRRRRGPAPGAELPTSRTPRFHPPRRQKPQTKHAESPAGGAAVAPGTSAGAG